MNGALLTLAAAATFAASPAPAQSLALGGFSGASTLGFVAPPAAQRFRGGGHHWRHIRVADALATAPLGYASGYLDPGDYDANRSFDPDRWNDWWHDRPERAFPRWMTRNRDCARLWYSGDVLTC